MTETKKAFRKLQKTGDIQASAQALCNLKGVGPTMASGTVGFPFSRALVVPMGRHSIVL